MVCNVMRIRAGVVILVGDRIALIERVKASRTYYVVPGGGVVDGEYTEEAACREAKEELGLDVTLERLFAVVERVERGAVTHVQLYYLVKTAAGVFGTGEGEEYGRSPTHGTYQAVWLPLADVKEHHSYPKVLMEYLAGNGIPEEILHLREDTDYPF